MLSMISDFFKLSKVIISKLSEGKYFIASTPSIIRKVVEASAMSLVCLKLKVLLLIYETG